MLDKLGNRTFVHFTIVFVKPPSDHNTVRQCGMSRKINGFSKKPRHVLPGRAILHVLMFPYLLLQFLQLQDITISSN